MIRVEANTVDMELMGETLPHVESRMEYNIESTTQFENEAESILWCLIMFMAKHSDSTEQSILLGLLADLEDNAETPPFVERADEYKEENNDNGAV